LCEQLFSLIIIIIIIFLHGLGRLNCSGIDALPSSPGTSTVSSFSGFAVEGACFGSLVLSVLSRWRSSFVCTWYEKKIFEISEWTRYQ